MTVREGNGLRADFVKKVGQINDSLVNGSQSGYDPGTDPKLGAEICRLKKKESGSNTGPYAYLEDGPTVGEGKDFTAAQKQKMLEENMKRNGGVVKSDNPNDYYDVLY